MLATLLGAAVLVLLVGWSGLVSISAASGHFAPVRWFLGWTMENAVRRQSMPVDRPAGLDLSDPALVLRAAGHFATGCAPCHAAPGIAQSPVAQAMTPAPPRLEGRVEDWDDRALFWIVRHGIKYSGMPAWPAQNRDDEVWAQVAFLRALPDMSAETYAEMALGGLRPPQLPGDAIFSDALEDCARCHGTDGLGRGEGRAKEAFPVIAGQPETYLYEILLAFHEGRRESGFMEPPARRYAPETLRRLAAHYAQQPAPDIAPVPPRPEGPLPPRVGQDEAGTLDGLETAAGFEVPPAAPGGPPASREALLDLGRRIAMEGLHARKVPSCQSCHARDERRNPNYPYLPGQPGWYVEEQLLLWREGARGGTGWSHVMTEIAQNLTRQQIEAVSLWYDHLREQ
ncbi:c-type cytochrome [Citreimonas salinaria]|nr:c-type cytochrome [Citreimonas salinaria]